RCGLRASAATRLRPPAIKPSRSASLRNSNALYRKVRPMLFLETKALNHAVDGDARTRLLQQLEERGLTPLIRSTRLRVFEDVLLNADRVAEVESALASW